jgi:hypothetical protein
MKNLNNMSAGTQCIIGGGVAAALGWGMLIFGVGVDTPIGAVANLHGVAVAQSLIISGFFGILIGVVKDGLEERKASAESAHSTAA